MSNLQEKLKRIQRKEDEEEKRVMRLDTNRMRRSRQDAEEQAMVEAIGKRTFLDGLLPRVWGVHERQSGKN